MGNHHVKAGSECPFKGRVIPFGAMVEYHPVSGANVLPSLARYISRLCVVCRGILERRRYGRRH